MQVKFNQVVVCGAGVMGAQIAAHLANSGLSVALLDLAAEKGDRNLRAKTALKQMAKMKPAPYDGSVSSQAIFPGNFDDHMGLIEKADWVIEAVVENLEIKKGLLVKIAEHRKNSTMVSTNTSGIPLKVLSEGMDDKFLKHFFGVHFFNPPRYLKLLEIIPGEKTDRVLLGKLCEFGRVQLGKGIVMAKDTPNFIGNRIGIYTMCKSLDPWAKGDFNLESLDLLTGPLIGRPKSATFRTTDVVGLDTFAHVANNLLSAVNEDDEQSVFDIPPVVKEMIEKGFLGAKVKKGFYSKVGKSIKVIDTNSWDYIDQSPEVFEELKGMMKLSLRERLAALYELDTKAGTFIKDHLLSVFGYSAKRVPEITDEPAAIDLAMKFGFGWELGPFEMWDAIGFEKVLTDLKARGFQCPEWLSKMDSLGHHSFYVTGAKVETYDPVNSRYLEESRAEDEWCVEDLERKEVPVLMKHEAGTLYDINDGVALLTFNTKANAFNASLIEACREAIDLVQSQDQLKGMVVANDGDLFSAGADLASMIQSFQKGDMASIEKLIVDFQNLGQIIRYSEKPIVFSVHGRALGGGIEMLMSSPEAVVSSEVYVGLVELGVGLLPAGTGCLRMIQRAMDNASSKKPVAVAALIEQYFMQIAQAKVSSGVNDAIELGFLPKDVTIVRKAERRMSVAKAKVEFLVSQGYCAPRPMPVLALGNPGYAKFMTIVSQFAEAGFATEYDVQLCSHVARVMTGGDLAASKFVPEQVILNLERQAFMSLIQNKKSQERIESMIFNKKPLRN